MGCTFSHAAMLLLLYCYTVIVVANPTPQERLMNLDQLAQQRQSPAGYIPQQQQHM